MRALISTFRQRQLLYSQAEICREELRLDNSVIKALTESFATAALGLKLGPPRVSFDDQLAVLKRQRDPLPEQHWPTWCGWQTDQGPLAIFALYDETQAALMKAHVLLFEWWIGDEVHQEGWWHCYPKFPRDWIKGAGRVNRW